ncbi:MAG: AAA family ATPase [Deltaproteobacteria bacterium]|nr:MAG: AAA family ATPase [Deltaproteobacteria bacterium]
MPGKWKVEDITIGATMETTFWPNPVKHSEFRYRATHLDGKRAPKVVLCDDKRIRQGVPCMVRVVALHKPDRPDRGMIEVEFVHSLSLKLEGIYIDPVVSRKLQILLESGLNILLDGPQGCGKTVLARAIADSLGMRFVFFNCSSVIEATDFLATIQVRASDSGQPITDFVKTDFLHALEEANLEENQTQPYLLFLDEFNRCQESARNALMPALDTTRQIFNPVTNSFITIPDNVQFIAAVNRGNEFSGTFGIDAAQLDRFAPLQMDYLPPKEEIKLLAGRHPEIGPKMLQTIVHIADRIRHTPELGAGLSVRATEEVCVYLKHPLMQDNQRRMLPEVLQSSFCGRFAGRWNDVSSDAGAVWAIVQDALREADTAQKKKNAASS